ncbi:hypothetical protein T310_1450 [Rasamsonia emersonii CBS 393.64]|uniref:Uncharacterized protein n=1 Tax=Rasamsonia emersonii (strain ATCC 16479 / CBS 393.64 / IMI 116815) TaxID=1408163 RepID=A0A0F4Z209_RASE3|nr:hypothetical protein T310_1450 [Rasamsonia emersonii CBS 393.64]KKA24549.1 hypothetical protein T310_1450 [Rasamsonia emersonii CBS 393.64]
MSYTKASFENPQGRLQIPTQVGFSRPQFSLGRFPNGSERINIEIPDAMFDSNSDCRAQVRKLRRACDGLYYIFFSEHTNMALKVIGTKRSKGQSRRERKSFACQAVSTKGASAVRDCQFVDRPRTLLPGYT